VEKFGHTGMDEALRLALIGVGERWEDIATDKCPRAQIRVRSETRRCDIIYE
jgi:hypothetical protein